jgi:photosystem II stability/assembly factor-like uncharacterized protein
MKRIVLIISIFGIAAVFSLAGGRSSQSGRTGQAQGLRSPETIEHDYDLIGERAGLYLERHGDNSRIDPERRLQSLSREYEFRRAQRASESPEAVAGNTWASLGPTNGAGRATAIAADPADPATLYIGAADGGAWKTTDNGATWAPLTDSINDLAVGALAVAPSSPNIIYLGTGEGGYAQDFVPGIGLLKSTDAGTSWIFPSSVIATKFYRISVHPTNPDELVAGTNQGGLRSTDGGTSWRPVIDTGAYRDVTDLVRDPSNSAVMYATTWDAFQWCARNGCQVSSARVLKSTDSGRTWIEKSSGLPASTASRRVGRMSIAIAPTRPNILYVAAGIDSGSFATEVSHVFKSTDSGESWTDLPSVYANGDSSVSNFMHGQSWYNNTIVVSPANENVVVAGGVFYIKSNDGGANWYTAPFMFTGLGPHVDAHDLRYAGSELLVACDGGIWRSPDDGDSATPLNRGLVTRQYYALSIDPINRNRILAGSQDNGTDERTDGGGSAWSNVLGGDGFECYTNSLAPGIAYATIQNGSIFRTKTAGWPDGPFFVDITPPYAYTEVVPFLTLVSGGPADPATIYTASYRVWRSPDGGDHWAPLGTATSDSSVWSISTGVTSFAVAPGDARSIVVAKSGGPAVFRTIDRGVSWTSISAGLPSTNVNCLAIDPVNSKVAYAGVAGTLGTAVFKTVDGGATWRRSATGLPQFSAQVLRIDPTDSSVIYCGTDVGVYRSTDGGGTWARFGSGLPASSVHDLQITSDGSILRVATHGRGVWELQIPASGVARPEAAITAPAGTLSIVKGATVQFVGSVSIGDGSQVQGTWFFPDTWQSVPAGAGESTVAHTFNIAGGFPVTLTARDSRGALGSATVIVLVSEPAANCATPIVIPGAGPFPFVSQVNNETAGGQFTNAFPDCAGGGGTSNPIWFEFTPAVSGKYEFTTCGSSLYLVVSLWKGPRCGPYSAVDGGCGNSAPAGSSCAGINKSPGVIVQANAGETLHLMVAGYFGGDLGTYTVTVNSFVPTITRASIAGKNLIVTGSGFDSGAVILLNSAEIRTIGDVTSPSTTLMGKKGAKKIAPGTTVTLQVRNSDGTLSNVFTYQRPSG